MQNRWLVVVIFIIIFLNGCISTPSKLGIEEAVWSTYDAAQQKEFLQNYRQILKTSYAKNKSRELQKDVFLEVSISGGKVMMPPFIEPSDYQPIKFVIFKEECRNIVLYSVHDKKSQIELSVCYCGNALRLDPSKYDISKQDGSISIHYSPLWLSGFVYQGINTSGYARLKDATVEIKYKKM